MRHQILILTLVHSILTPSFAQEKAVTNPGLCANVSCTKRTESEEPGEKAEREGNAFIEGLRRGDNDKERWKWVKLYSDSVSAEELSMPVVKSAGTSISLDPKTGRVSLHGPQRVDIFEIASAKGEKRGDCFEYTVSITEASSKHALIRLQCSPVEYRPGKYRSSVNYYLYDVETAMMRAIWRRTATGKDAPVPDATPGLALQTLPNGFRFEWAGYKNGTSPSEKLEAHAVYLRKTVDGKRILTCKDTSGLNSGGFEDGVCLFEVPNNLGKY